MITGEFTGPDGGVHASAVCYVSPIRYALVTDVADSVFFTAEIWVTAAAKTAGKPSYKSTYTVSAAAFDTLYQAAALACHTDMAAASTTQQKIDALTAALTYAGEQHLLGLAAFTGWT